MALNEVQRQMRRSWQDCQGVAEVMMRRVHEAEPRVRVPAQMESGERQDLGGLGKKSEESVLAVAALKIQSASHWQVLEHLTWVTLRDWTSTLSVSARLCGSRISR